MVKEKDMHEYQKTKYGTPKIEKTITINKPVKEVFDYLRDFNNHKIWQSTVANSMQITQGRTMDVGAKLMKVTKLLGEQFESMMKVTEFEENKKIVLEADSGILQEEQTFEFIPEDGSTRLSWIVDAHARHEIKPDVAQRAAAQVEKDLQMLKEILESH